MAVGRVGSPIGYQDETGEGSVVKTGRVVVGGGACDLLLSTTNLRHFPLPNTIRLT